MEEQAKNQENQNTEVKQETIMDTANTKDTKKKNTKNSKLRMILVIIFLLIFALISYVQLRGSYLEYLELGEKYTSVFYTNLFYRYTIMAVNFVFLYIVIYFTNRGIKKGIKPFFDKEKKEMPKLLNKSLALVISAIASIVISSVFMQKIMLAINSASYGMTDPIFGLDISYYIFQKPVLETIVMYFIFLFVSLSLYMSLYYVIVFNRYFDGIDGKMLKESLFMKKLTRNIFLIVIGIALMTILNVQSIMFGKILTVNEDIDIVGAGLTESTVKLWGYVIFAFVIVIFAYRAIKYFKEGKTNKVLKNLLVIPGYLVVLFVVMIGFDLIFVNSNELDKEKAYLEENIRNTKNAYNLNIEEANVESTGTITREEVNSNRDVINNIPIISQNVVLTSLANEQTGTGYYSYRSAELAKYEIDGEDTLVYLAPREITSSGRTYNNKTYEYTHGMGEVVASASESTESGNISYIQKDVSGKDEKINVERPEIYFGLETNEIVATNAKSRQEYDYTDEVGTDYTSTYEGEAGLQLNFLDRLILGITKGDLNLAFSSEITDDSKILLNREVITRAKKALPYLIYDENPYTVITDDGRIVWVIDAYTVSNCYPYSQYTEIEHDNITEDINYIRNSVKVIVDAYDGTLSYYITDRTDPIAMTYRNIYKDLFMDLDAEIPADISEHFVYPEFLYNVQAEVLKLYHNVKADVLYRADDVWDIADFNTTRATSSRTTGTEMEPYYTMLKTNNSETEFGLVQIYTPSERQNIISYLVGTTDGGTNRLSLYKFSEDSNIVGPMQLDNQIEQDEAISSELDALSTTGTRLTKQMIVVPINNTLLYVEPIYQTMLNESEVPILRKVIVASGNKVAIGDDFQTALNNLLSQNAVDIEVENTEDIDGLIDAIIKANQNLTESSNNNDWEMMGSDIQRLQDLITSLESAKEEEDKKQEELEATQGGNTTDSANTSTEQTNIIDAGNNDNNSNGDSNNNSNQNTSNTQNEENTNISE